MRLIKDHKRLVKTFAKNYRMDRDEFLIILWDYKAKQSNFNYLKDGNSVIKRKDIKLVRTIISSKLKQKDSNIYVKPIKLIHKEFNFSSIGRSISSISYITKGEILKIYEELTNDFKNLADPISPSGIKDEALLESALFHPKTSFGDKLKYPTVESAGAALMYSLSHNHAFHNGNKRTAMVAMLVFLDRHNLHPTCHENDLFKISLELADHKLVAPEYQYSDAEIYTLGRWIHDNSRLMKKGERPITLRKLKQILAYFDCKIIENGKMERVIYQNNFLGIPKKRILHSRNSIVDTLNEGAEVSFRLIKSIREDLELDSLHGIDSEAFYHQTEFSSSDFIIKYKNLLRRLSKV